MKYTLYQSFANPDRAQELKDYFERRVGLDINMVARYINKCGES